MAKKSSSQTVKKSRRISNKPSTIGGLQRFSGTNALAILLIAITFLGIGFIGSRVFNRSSYAQTYWDDSFHEGLTLHACKYSVSGGYKVKGAFGFAHAGAYSQHQWGGIHSGYYGVTHWVGTTVPSGPQTVTAYFTVPSGTWVAFWVSQGPSATANVHQVLASLPAGNLSYC